MKKIVFTTLICMMGLVGCSKSEAPKTETTNNGTNEQTTSKPVEQQTSQPTEEEIKQKLRAVSLPEFIDQLKPQMEDTLNKHPESAGMLAYFMEIKGIKLSDINKLSATTRGKILKDSEAEKGKKLCVSGSIIQISADRSGGFPAYTGIISNSSFEPIMFIALGDTGELEAQSNARFCGVTVGKTSYSNTGGGESTAPYVVGMFDLPANK